FRNRRPRGSDEGQWVLQPKPIHTLRLFSSRDLVILDAQFRVLEAIESWPSLRFVPLREEAASMLTLPVHTIYSSQTQPGHRLIICLPEEMKERLRSAPPVPPLPVPLMDEPDCPEAVSPDPGASLLNRSQSPAPLAGQKPRPPEEPRLVAYDAKDSGLKMYSVREVSGTGLFLATQERWPLGTQSALTLQRMDGISDSLLPAITVEMRVDRWGDDGMGFTFVSPGALEPLLTELIGR
ncbi:MAG: hypothetical protein ACRD25_06260, partial [Terracidiphilus sp.]